MTERTLRDDFAIAALTGILAGDDSLLAISRITQKSGGRPSEFAAGLAYEIADAMLEERKPDPLDRDARGVTKGMRDFIGGAKR